MTLVMKNLTTRLSWKPKPNWKPRFFLQNLPKPTDRKHFETVTTLHTSEITRKPTKEYYSWHICLWTMLVISLTVTHTNTDNMQAYKWTVQNPSTRCQWYYWRLQQQKCYNATCTKALFLCCLLFCSNMYKRGNWLKQEVKVVVKRLVRNDINSQITNNYDCNCGDCIAKRKHLHRVNIH